MFSLRKGLEQKAEVIISHMDTINEACNKFLEGEERLNPNREQYSNLRREYHQILLAKAEFEAYYMPNLELYLFGLERTLDEYEQEIEFTEK